MERVRPLLLSLSTGYALMFFSEHLFWARPRPFDTPGDWAATWLAYSLLAFVFLCAVRHFRVRSLESLFVAGALVGWLGEGVLVQTLYDSFPLQISWTGLAWHALISVCIGWFGLRQALAAPRIRRRVLWSLGLGVFWGLWSIFWRVEEPGGEASVPAFLGFAFLTTSFLVLSLWAYESAAPQAFRPSRFSVGVALVALLLIFAFVTVPAAPMAILVLPVLLALVVVALSRNRACETGDDLLAQSATRPLRPGALPVLLIMPATATLIYGVAVALDLRWHTNWAVYLVTMPAGFLLFIVAWIRLVRRKPVAA